MRGEILAVTTGDALVPMFSILARALAAKFECEPTSVQVGLRLHDGRLMPSFGVSEDAVAKTGMSEEQAREFIRHAWQLSRPSVQHVVRRVRERWHEFA